MQVNLKKLEARIEKLQEIKRIAADPELMSLLQEFLAADDERKEPVPFKAQSSPGAPSPEHIDLVDKVMKGLEPPPRGAWAGNRG